MAHSRSVLCRFAMCGLAVLAASSCTALPRYDGPTGRYWTYDSICKTNRARAVPAGLASARGAYTFVIDRAAWQEELAQLRRKALASGFQDVVEGAFLGDSKLAVLRGKARLPNQTYFDREFKLACDIEPKNGDLFNTRIDDATPTGEPVQIL